MLYSLELQTTVILNTFCRSTDKAAYSICFSTECASYNGNHPISRRGGDHVVHARLPPAGHMHADMHTNLVEAVLRSIKRATLSRGETAASVEKLKVEHVCAWVRGVCATRRAVCVACLLPHPPHYTRHAGHWDTLATKTQHLKDGLNR
ncbi:Uncharacterized protein OBRU01_18969 [Operophtera brumata]|uniref:Uncharacterized protein n=1 Tax=Operophtera brumata TaxID=104452 RepID=A0A0L7KY77_OPEBR|nr:Uncharacterized protein OBRU01_18969 [Operophtera brumata]